MIDITYFEKCIFLSELEKQFLELERKYRNNNILFLIDVELYTIFNDIYFFNEGDFINELKFYFNGNNIVISCDDNISRKYNILISDYSFKDCDYNKYIRVLEIKQENIVDVCFSID